MVPYAVDNVTAFVAQLQAHGAFHHRRSWVYKLRRAAQLIAPANDFQWLTEIEKDIAPDYDTAVKGRPAGPN